LHEKGGTVRVAKIFLREIQKAESRLKIVHS
jgi:hypothetical protein